MIGGKDAVPVLAGLLADETYETASAADGEPRLTRASGREVRARLAGLSALWLRYAPAGAGDWPDPPAGLGPVNGHLMKEPHASHRPGWTLSPYARAAELSFLIVSGPEQAQLASDAHRGPKRAVARSHRLHREAYSGQVLSLRLPAQGPGQRYSTQ